MRTFKQFVINENRVLTENEQAEEYASSLGLEVDGHLGSGEFGHAYLTNDERVIKVTTDETEWENAKKLVGEKFRNVADVYHVNSSSDPYWAYLLEYLL